ncbi:MAG: tyrosine-type recombinase/integrase [Sideroxydans sp.]|nr:tyrosine-type recombinase/integrase [Sideroxydans sp.]
MNRLDEYVSAGERENTRKSYASALRHFEIEWKGFLPATADSVARYLADHGASLSMNTLRHRLAALSRWHSENGFPDPTRTPLVRRVLKGIRTLHPAQEKRARPIQLEVLNELDDWLECSISASEREGKNPQLLRYTRDRTILLLGFWRGFRADELVNLRIEHVEVSPGKGLVCYLPRSKGDRSLEGRTFRCPALSRLCPVAAFEAWIAQSGLKKGPVFRKVDQWGHIAGGGLAANSLIPLLRRLFTEAGIENPEEYSSHSLRRGFAGWARSNGWDMQELMEYVGWRDIKSAMRYLDAEPQDLKERFERGLSTQQSTPPKERSRKRGHLTLVPPLK